MACCKTVWVMKNEFLSGKSARPKLKEVLIVRMAPELRAKLDEVRLQIPMTRSEFVRRAISAAADALMENRCECAEISVSPSQTSI